MIRKVKLRDCCLQRVHSKLGEIITWDVLSLDGKVRLAVIAQKNSEWLNKTIPGRHWQKVPVKYWICHIFSLYPTILVAETRKQAILNVLTVRRIDS